MVAQILLTPTMLQLELTLLVTMDEVVVRLEWYLQAVTITEQSWTFSIN